MKNLTMTVAVLLTVLSTAFASGNEITKNRATVVAGNNETYKVLYTNDESVIVKIRIRDENGKLLKMDRIKSKGGFMQPYNFSELENGTYFIELSDPQGIVSEKVELTDNSNSMLSVTSLENHKYQLLVEQNEQLPLTLTIYNAEDEVIHKEHHSNMTGFRRVYDLSNFNSDNFVFQLTDKTSTRIVAVD